ncbi:hypothetical protein, partial [Klebsiella aerogenes]|uniref:hypothetical protein n=1 Tax=Klebsiella aerogenes TaxID=548 RepID=UPI00195470B1
SIEDRQHLEGTRNSPSARLDRYHRRRISLPDMTKGSMIIPWWENEDENGDKWLIACFRPQPGGLQ